jgi:polyisoprenyl-teichoic acid--peptidoglycan teichoic acid transferase
VSDETPAIGAGLLKKAFLAGILIVLMTAGSVAAAGFLTADDLINVIEAQGREPIEIPENEIDRAEAGGAQTLMILGSDARYGDDKRGVKPRSDTIILVRLDPDKQAIALMSIPRDLKVQIPGYGTDKINAAYEAGGVRLTLKTVKQLLSRPGKPFEVNHIVQIDFAGFRKAIDFIGCVYADIDRRYFNDNSDGSNYATIDIQPGYQKICGRDALDYVRYRHGDDDLVRAARQQDFLRQIKSQSGVRKLLTWDARRDVARLVGRYTDTDKGLRNKSQVFSLLKLVLFTAKNPIQEVRFRVSYSPDLIYLLASKEQLAQSVREFLSAKGSAKPRSSSGASGDDDVRKKRKSNNAAADVPGLEVATAEGENQAVLAAKKAKLPFYFPTLRTSGAAYTSQEPRIYTLKDELGDRQNAYRLVVHRGLVGEYYGIQGMTWRHPPILDSPDETRRVNGRKLQIYRDGQRVRLVAWRTRKAVYWVTNTLTQSIGERQMIAITASLKKLGR